MTYRGLDEDDGGIGQFRLTYRLAAYGVDDDLVNEWFISQPHFAGGWVHCCQQTQEKGCRRSYESPGFLAGRSRRELQPDEFGAAAQRGFAGSVMNIRTGHHS